VQKPTAQPALQLRMAKEVRVVGWQIAGLDPGKEGALWSFCVFFKMLNNCILCEIFM